MRRYFFLVQESLHLKTSISQQPEGLLPCFKRMMRLFMSVLSNCEVRYDKFLAMGIWIFSPKLGVQNTPKIALGIYGIGN